MLHHGEVQQYSGSVAPTSICQSQWQKWRRDWKEARWLVGGGRETISAGLYSLLSTVCGGVWAVCVQCVCAVCVYSRFVR